ncbi:MAG: hypothetical protein M3178_09280 [Pseudomonadota bacterium]|nr:hypothetical protein [Pseudomonadota bacterium]
MSRVLTIGMLMILAAVTGFYVHDYLRSDDRNASHFSFQDKNPRDVKPVKPNQGFACKFLGYAFAGENKLGDPNPWSRQWGKLSGPDVEVRYARESEGVALRISDEGKDIFMLTETAVSVGISEAGELPIAFDGIEYLVATDKSDPTSIKSLVIDKKTLRAVYSFTGLGPWGIGVSSHVLECH